MRINGDYILREIVGETILIPVGNTALEYNGMMILNDTGSFIWKALNNGDPEETILSGLIDTYEVTPKEAAADLKEFLNTLTEAGILDR